MQHIGIVLPSEEEVAKLTGRIDTLEQRVAELEAQVRAGGWQWGAQGEPRGRARKKGNVCLQRTRLLTHPRLTPARLTHARALLLPPPPRT